MRLCGDWQRRRILPRDGWRSHNCQRQSRKSLPEGDRRAHVQRVEPSGEGPMLALRKARAVMEVCKADLGLALAQNFNKGCRRTRADLRYEEPQSERYAGLSPLAGASGPPAGYRRAGPLGVRRGHGGIGPGRHYLGIQRCGRLADSILNRTNIILGFSPPLSLSHHSQFWALVPKLYFLGALLETRTETPCCEGVMWQ